MPEEMLDEREFRCQSRDSNEGDLLVTLNERDMLCKTVVLKTLCDVCSVRRRLEFEEHLSSKTDFIKVTKSCSHQLKQLQTPPENKLSSSMPQPKPGTINEKWCQRR
jgi:hypothetical protein